MTWRWAAAALILILIAGSCAPAHVDQPRQPKTWWLPLSAKNSDEFCVQPSDFGERWPPRCRSVGELRDWLGSLKAN